MVLHAVSDRRRAAVVDRGALQLEAAFAKRDDPALLFCLLWLVIPFVFFSLSQSKRPQYILPLMPAIALLVARIWDEARTRARGDRASRSSAASCSSAPLFFHRTKMKPEIAAVADETAIALGVAFAIGGLVALFAKRRELVLIALTLPVIALAARRRSAACARSRERRSTKSFVAELQPHLTPDTEVIGVEAFTGSMAFYLRRPIIVVTEDASELTSNYLIRRYDRYIDAIPPRRSSRCRTSSDRSRAPTPRVYIAAQQGREAARAAGVARVADGRGRRASRGVREVSRAGPAVRASCWHGVRRRATASAIAARLPLPGVPTADLPVQCAPRCAASTESSSAAALRHPAVLDEMGEALRHRGPDGQRGRSRSRTRASARSGCASSTCTSAPISRSRRRTVRSGSRRTARSTTPRRSARATPTIRIARTPTSRRSCRSISSTVRARSRSSTACSASRSGTTARSTLLLARDRAGEKPLFYARVGGEVLFASELQCLLRHPDVSRELDRVAIDEYLALGYIPEPRTPFTAIRRVPAGTYMLFRDGGEETVRYWDPATFAIEPIDPREAVRETQRLIENAVHEAGDVGRAGRRLHQRRARLVDPGDAGVAGDRRRQGAHVLGAVRRGVV